MCGSQRAHIASIRKTPCDRAASINDDASFAVMVNGFSTSTALPALMADNAASWWPGCGVLT